MPAPRQSTGFVNWSNFVNANRSGAGRVASSLQQPYQQDMQRADAGFRGGQELFGRDVGANTLEYDPNRADGEDMRNYSYGGPSSLMDEQEFASGYGDAQHAEQGAKRLADAYGRMGLLRDFYGAKSPTYGLGQQTFDSALLGSVGQGGFESTSKGATSLLGRFKDAQAASVGTANDARERTRQAAGRYMSDYNAPPALGGDQVHSPIVTPGTTAPPATLGDLYTRRNEPDYLNAGDPRIKKKGGR